MNILNTVINDSATVSINERTITFSGFVISTDQRIYVDGSSQNIVLILPVPTDAFRKKESLHIVRVDTSTNKVQIVGEFGDVTYVDNGFEIGRDPLKQSIRVFVDKDDIWRSDGYGKFDQQVYYSSLSTGIITLTGDPKTLITDNGDGTIDINHGGTYRIVSRVDTFNFESQSNIRSFVATSNIDHTASGTDGNKVIIVNNAGAISVVALPSELAKLSSDEGAGAPNFNTHLQIGSLTKASGVINNFLDVITINNNIYNNVRFVIDTISVINSAGTPQDIVISGNNDLKLKYTKGSAMVTDIGFAKTGGLSQHQDMLLVDIPDVPLVHVTRDGIIDSISLDLDVLNIEVGTLLTPMGNNQAANRYVLGFADEEFVAILYGQEDFGTIAAAANAPEFLDNIALTQFGVKMRKISVNKSETDNANFLTKLLKQFR